MYDEEKEESKKKLLEVNKSFEIILKFHLLIVRYQNIFIFIVAMRFA